MKVLRKQYKQSKKGYVNNIIQIISTNKYNWTFPDRVKYMFGMDVKKTIKKKIDKQS